MTRQDKIKALERHGLEVILCYSSSSPTCRVLLRLPGTCHCRLYSSVNDAYNHRPWN